MHEKIKRWYNWYKMGLWTAEMIQAAADKGVITQSQADEILGEVE